MVLIEETCLIFEVRIALRTLRGAYRFDAGLES